MGRVRAFCASTLLLGMLAGVGCEVQTKLERKPAGTVTEVDVPATAKVFIVQAEDGTRCMLASNGQGGYGAITCDWSCQSEKVQ